MNRNEEGITADLKNPDDLVRVRQLTLSLIRTDGQVPTSGRSAPKFGQHKEFIDAVFRLESEVYA